MSTLNDLTDSRSLHDACRWNTRRDAMRLDAHEVDGTLYSGPRGDELGTRVQDLWAAEAEELIADLTVALRLLPHTSARAFGSYATDLIRAAVAATAPPERPEPTDAAAALDAHKTERTGTVGATLDTSVA